MATIKMVDLENQHQRIKEEIDTAMLQVVHHAHFIQGEEVHIFAKLLSDFLNIKHVIPCGNGTDALQLALMALNLPKGSEVLVPSFSYIAAAEVVAMLGYKPVFIEADEKTFNLDASKIEQLVTEHTKAIIPVHLFGQGCNMLAILKLAQLYNLYVVEDNAQSLGADFYFPDNSVKKLGAIGHIGTTSFFPSKNLGCMGDGGAVFTNDDELAIKMKTIANHGQKEKYLHQQVGINSRLDTLQAAVLLVKLKYFSQYTSARQKAAAQYDQLLSAIPELEIPYRAENSSHVFHQYTLKVKGGNRDKLKQFLQETGIPSMVYYPKPIHQQEAYQAFYQQQPLEATETLAAEVLSLPMHTELDEAQIGFITKNIAHFFGR